MPYHSHEGHLIEIGDGFSSRKRRLVLTPEHAEAWPDEGISYTSLPQNNDEVTRHRGGTGWRRPTFISDPKGVSNTEGYYPYQAEYSPSASRVSSREDRNNGQQRVVRVDEQSQARGPPPTFMLNGMGGQSNQSATGPSSSAGIEDWQTQHHQTSFAFDFPELLQSQHGWAHQHEGYQGGDDHVEESTLDLSAIPNPGRYLRPSSTLLGTAASQQGRPSWPPQPVYQDAAATMMATSEVPKLDDIQEVASRFPEPWSMVGIADQQQTHPDNNTGLAYLYERQDVTPSSVYSCEPTSFPLSFDASISSPNTSLHHGGLEDSQVTMTGMSPAVDMRLSSSVNATFGYSNMPMVAVSEAEEVSTYEELAHRTSPSWPYVTQLEVPHHYPDSSIPSSPALSSRSNTSLPEVLPCSIDGCPTTFTGNFRLGNQKRHMRHKHGPVEKSMDCEVEGCTKVFRRQDSRLKHYRKRHPHLASGPVSRKGGRD